MYTQEQIEKKRLDALRRQQQKIVASSSSATTSSSFNSHANQNQSLNTTVNGGNNLGLNFTNQNLQTKSQRPFKQQNKSNRYHPMQRPTNFYSQQQPKCEVICIMITSCRFAVELSKYNQKLIELFKTVPTRLYDTKTKLWNFHIVDHEILQKSILPFQAEVIFKPLPNFVFKTFENLSKEKVEKRAADLSQIDSVLLSSLYPFQKEGIEFGISKGGKCLIADDMGLGKTRQALGIAHYFKKDWPLLIIAPSSVRYQWSEAIIESLPSVPVQYIQHITSTKDYIDTSQVTIISYDLLSKRIDEISARKFGFIICDESHYLKSSKTQRTKAVQQLATNSSHVILLTGTPALSRPIELYPQIKLVMPSFMSVKEFGVRYCAGVQNHFGWDFSGSSNLKELELVLKACCLIRRLKSDVMTQLPSKLRQKVMLDPYLIKAATKEMENASRELEESNKRGAQKHQALLQYFSASSKAKEKAVCNYISDLTESEQKFLVFAHHKNILDAIENTLNAKKKRFIRIDGTTPAEARKSAVDRFQEDESTQVAVLSIMAANAGITLTAARIVVFAELFWTPGILIQAEDRVHRIGQTDNVVIRYLLAKDTVDDYLWPAIKKKIDVLNEVGLDQNFDLDEADVENQPTSNENQPKLNDFLVVLDKHSKSLELESTGNADLSAGNLKDLLDMDDEAFLTIDLDQLKK